MDAKWFRNSFIWLIVMVFVLAIAFQVFRSQGSQTKNIPATGGANSLVGRIQTDVQQGRTATITQNGSDVTLQEGSDTTRYDTSISDRLDVTEFLRNTGVRTAGPSFQRLITIKYA